MTTIAVQGNTMLTPCDTTIVQTTIPGSPCVPGMPLPKKSPVRPAFSKMWRISVSGLMKRCSCDPSCTSLPEALRKSIALELGGASGTLHTNPGSDKARYRSGLAFCQSVITIAVLPSLRLTHPLSCFKRLSFLFSLWNSPESGAPTVVYRQRFSKAN